jgi:hypothetical protein
VENSEIFTSTSGLAIREELRIFQGNKALARNNVNLGCLDVTFTQSQCPPEVSLTFSMRTASILYVSAYNPASPSLRQTTSFHIDPYFEKNEVVLCDEDEEVHFIKAKENAENTLQITKAALVDKETLNEVPSISSCFNELEAALQTNDFGAASAIDDRTLALKNATMHHFERTHYRSFNKPIFANLDSQLHLF